MPYWHSTFDGGDPPKLTTVPPAGHCLNSSTWWIDTSGASIHGSQMIYPFQLKPPAGWQFCSRQKQKQKKTKTKHNYYRHHQTFIWHFYITLWTQTGKATDITLSFTLCLVLKRMSDVCIHKYFTRSEYVPLLAFYIDTCCALTDLSF